MDDSKPDLLADSLNDLAKKRNNVKSFNYPSYFSKTVTFKKALYSTEVGTV